MERPRLAITMGDPAGVGPELCLRLFADAAIASTCTPIVFGDAGVLARVAALLDLPMSDEGRVRDLRCLEAASVVPGKADARCGAAAFSYVSAAIDAALAGEVAGVVTAPICKEALHAAGHRFPGHTEIFAERMGAARSCMMQYSEEITCSFATTHVGYVEAAALLTTARILEVIELTDAALRRIRGDRRVENPSYERAPRLLVCGLNPHAGEGGLFGVREEERIIAPAVALAKEQGIDATGPVPPDTAFTPARRREFDAVVCMTHDQGHIPVKALAFDSAVNTTLGLPIVRTSVDHGTAFDIAWRGVASAGSLFAAVRLAAKLAR